MFLDLFPSFDFILFSFLFKRLFCPFLLYLFISPLFFYLLTELSPS
jgi:hypothetical protein